MSDKLQTISRLLKNASTALGSKDVMTVADRTTMLTFLKMNHINTHSTDEAALLGALFEAQLNYYRNRFYIMQIFLLAGYGIMFTLCVILICYMRYNRYAALRGDANAARKILLPAFEPLLWILGCATGMYTIYFCLVLSLNVYTSEISKVSTEIFYSGRQFVFVLVIVFMLQKSASIPSLQRTVLISTIFSTYTIPIVWYMSQYGNTPSLYYVTTSSRAFLLLLYTYVFIHPPPRASKRTIREYCIFAYVYYILLFTYGELFYQSEVEAGFNLTYANLLFGSLCPLVIWRLLKADTEYWRGMGQRACALQFIFRQKHEIHERVSSQGLHVLIEMHRKFIIDFAYLKLKKRIGVGASAVVLNGILRSKLPVAIKVYTPSKYSEETVAAFSQEAALCGALKHPNIVQFYGMCVCPPTICLVSELCQGSLEAVTKAISRRQCCANREQFAINLAYMIDAARAIAYIHSFSPAFVHRDIKPANFLVDAENNVKLTDFGDSRSLPRSQIISSGNAQTHADPGASKGLSDGYESKCHGLKMTVCGTVDYMAPEVINGKSGVATYGEAADVYSLAITMWDILYPDVEKFPMVKKNNYLQIFDCVVDGMRPELGPNLHPALRDIIAAAWHSDARMRPTAQDIVFVLEAVQEEYMASFVSKLTKCRDKSMSQWRGPSIESKSAFFTAGELTDDLQRLGYVEDVREAIRLGNAMMDAGFVHHIKHNLAFGHCEAIYCFDEDHMNLGQLHDLNSDFCITETSETCDETSDFATYLQQDLIKKKSRPITCQEYIRTMSTRSEKQTHERFAPCDCRKHGQRLEVQKMSRRRFRKKYRSIREETMLTVHLLEDGQNGDLSTFDESPCNE